MKSTAGIMSSLEGNLRQYIKQILVEARAFQGLSDQEWDEIKNDLFPKELDHTRGRVLQDLSSSVRKRVAFPAGFFTRSSSLKYLMTNILLRILKGIVDNRSSSKDPRHTKIYQHGYETILVGPKSKKELKTFIESHPDYLEFLEESNEMMHFAIKLIAATDSDHDLINLRNTAEQNGEFFNQAFELGQYL